MILDIFVQVGKALDLKRRINKDLIINVKQEVNEQYCSFKRGFTGCFGPRAFVSCLQRQRLSD